MFIAIAVLIACIALYALFLLYVCIATKRADKLRGYAASANYLDLTHAYQDESEGEQAISNLTAYLLQVLHCQLLLRFVPSQMFTETRRRLTADT